MRLGNICLLSRLDHSGCLMDALGPDLLMFCYLSATFSSYSLFFYFSLLYKILTKSEPRMWPPLSFSRLMKVYASFCEKLSDFSSQVRGIYIPTLHICRFCCSVVSSTVCDCNFFFRFGYFGEHVGSFIFLIKIFFIL